MWLLPLGAAAVSAVFAGTLAVQWARRRRPNVLAWSVALAMFALASLAPAVGMLGTWTPMWFRIYYLFGAVANVPVLALGTVYLLASRRAGHVAAAAVVVASLVAAAIVLRARVDVARLHTEGIPRGSEVVSPGVRNLARVYSFAGFFVVLGGALWSSARLLRLGQPQLRRLAAANLLIAAGTFVVALGSGFAFYGRGSPFAVGLFCGVSLMYAGFLRTRLPKVAEP
jgi:hypothetical protein